MTGQTEVTVVFADEEKQALVFKTMEEFCTWVARTVPRVSLICLIKEKKPKKPEVPSNQNPCDHPTCSGLSCSDCGFNRENK